MLITTSEALRDFLATLQGAHYVAVDTEFMREKTYYAKLCLIQIADEEGNATLIDPLALQDLSPLRDLMTNPDTVKVFHAGGQDLEILYHLLGEPVAPHFDTQAAASLIGFNGQVGYGALVSELLGVTLEKTESFTDWSRRPLAQSQLSYAADDVVYLARIYPLMKARLEELGRERWIAPELREQEQASYFEIDYPHLFWKVKKISSLAPRQLAIAREVAIWREKVAQERNVPKKWICADETVIELARRAPQTPESVKSIRGAASLSQKHIAGLLLAIERGKATPREQWPTPRRKPRRTDDLEERVDLMMALVRVRAKENNIATSLLASRADLEDLALGGETNPLMSGWRKSMIGDELKSLLAGEISLSLGNEGLVIVAQ